jgi:trehalose-6-phosphate synthase
LKSEWWESYVEASIAFTLAASVAVDKTDPGATLWIHDYHLFLVPDRLRVAGRDNPIAFFLHTPFPSPTVFGRLPQRSELLRGLSGADVVGFQTEGDRRRFVETWARYGVGDPPATIAAPASVDTNAYRDMVQSPVVQRRALRLRERFAGKVLLFGIERLDYTKGIPERLRGLERLLERRPDLRKRVVYVQIASPSRERLPEYRRIRMEVEREIGRLNGRFTVPGGEVPFRYLHRSVSQEQLMAYFIAADIALVTPLQDGMNLVAKEYVVTQAFAKGAGALVLSEFAGAASELIEASQCNPYDVDGIADAIESAIEMDEDERRKRLAVMAVQIENNDVHHWADQQLRLAESIAGTRV